MIGPGAAGWGELARGALLCAPTHSPLTTHLFWQYNEALDPTLVVITPSPNSDTVLDVLGAIPVAELDAEPTAKNNSTSSETSAQVVKQYLDTVYKQASQQAVLTAMNTEMSWQLMLGWHNSKCTRSRVS